MQISAPGLSDNRSLHRVLVADDDPILCELMEAKLGTGQMSICTVNDGAAAWKKLKETRFDLAIIDLNMPELNGFELIHHLRQTPRTLDLPIIVATSRNDEEAIQRSFAAGATSFITKPINWSLLNHQIRFVLRSSEVERELRQARVAADLANRTKDNLFQLLGHELRTPLNVLVGFADVLKAELAKKLKAEEKEHLENMTDAAMRLNSVVGDVLTYSRLFAGTAVSTPEECFVSDIIEDCQVMAKAQAHASGVRLVAESLLEPIALSCDRRQILDGFNRLIENAIKFSQPEGIVEVWATFRPGNCLDLSVRDKGPGIEADRLAECLKPFFQADMSTTRNVEGLGLGLAIAKKIAELHDGSLIIESSNNTGTVATIRLPANRVIEPNRQQSA